MGEGHPGRDPGERLRLDTRAGIADNATMRQVPVSLKVVAVVSLVAEAAAAALTFWHTGPRAR